jgi:hypothetical protein
MFWVQVTLIPTHFHSLDTHTIFSSNSSEIEDQIVMTFSGVMDEAMSILQMEEAVAAATSSSTWRSKHHRYYVNRDRVYPVSYFRRRYRIWKTLFLSIMHKFSETSSYFSERHRLVSQPVFKEKRIWFLEECFWAFNLTWPSMCRTSSTRLM